MNEETVKRMRDYPRFMECSIQTFNDQDKEEKSQSRILPMTEENLEKCVKLQEKLPYWIFFSVNPMEEGKRNRDSVKAIQTWICDIDEWSKEEQLELIKNAPLKPSLVVESNHWFHLYYLANGDIPEHEFSKWNLGLKNYYNGDIKVCKDTARVLRIPGFYHMKWEAYMVNYREDLSSKARYSIAQMYEAFPKQWESKPLPPQRWFRTRYKANDIRERIYNLDQMELLSRFSGSSRVKGDLIDFKNNGNWEYQIRVNWESTSCWIDSDHKIWSSDKGWPTITQWIERYYKWGVDIHELLEELKKMYPELEDKKIEKLEVGDKTSEINIEKLEFTWWDKGIDDKIGKLHRWAFVILTWETGAGKTTFSTFVARHNKNSVYYVLEDKIKNIIRRYALRYAGITKEECNDWVIPQEKLDMFKYAVEDYQKSPVNMIDVGHAINIESLVASIKEQEKKGYWLFFIDNMGKITADLSTESDQTKHISSELLRLCNEDNICIVLIHHYRKKANQLEWRWIESLRWSQKLADDSTLIVEYERDEWEKSCRLKVYKDRDWWDIGEYELIYNRWEYSLNNFEI